MKKKDVEENLIVDFEKDEEYQALPSLSAREKAFVIEYLRTYDARKAGKKAGIKSGSLNTLPFVWIKKDSIAAHIKYMQTVQMKHVICPTRKNIQYETAKMCMLDVEKGEIKARDKVDACKYYTNEFAKNESIAMSDDTVVKYRLLFEDNAKVSFDDEESNNSDNNDEYTQDDDIKESLEFARLNTDKK